MSFKIGGVRLMNDLVEKDEWTRMQHWLQKNAALRLQTRRRSVREEISISCTSSACSSLQTPLEYSYVSEQQEELNALSAEERVTEVGLNFDRADIIVHALPHLSKGHALVGVVTKFMYLKSGFRMVLVRDYVPQGLQGPDRTLVISRIENINENHYCRWYRLCTFDVRNNLIPLYNGQ